MHIIWALLMILIGLFMLVCGLRKSNFIIYRFLVSKSSMLWGDNVHKFYVASGILIIIMGILMGIGVF
ncbi:MAG: hypothetical protein U9N10_08215 [Bacillota bacterium]|nr:hypothetical protein [Bacillota bacterium]